MWRSVVTLAFLTACSSDPVTGPTPTFFVTSEGTEQGGDLGGLAGADARCAELAEAAGLPGSVDWRAYLSASSASPGGLIHARDRIGEGPWHTADGRLVALDLEALHANGVPDILMLDEYGEPASKSPPPGFEHDILTGSDPSGRLAGENLTCGDWTSSSPDEFTRVGHHDWERLPNGDWQQHWVDVHAATCDPEGMRRQFGTSRFYCFGVVLD